MIAQALWILGAAIFLVLGTLHLLYTFFTNKFLARNPDTVEAMKETHPLLTRRTTMWKAWVGFNASHSVGAIFFAIVNITLASAYFNILEGSIAIMLLNIGVSIFYLFLAIKYWFRVPYTGICIATGCFIVSAVIMIMS